MAERRTNMLALRISAGDKPCANTWCDGSEGEQGGVLSESRTSTWRGSSEGEQRGVLSVGEHFVVGEVDLDLHRRRESVRMSSQATAQFLQLTPSFGYYPTWRLPTERIPLFGKSPIW